MEYKAVGLSGFKADESEPGMVTAIVAVTGKQDNVKDIIAPGAFEESLGKRTPKGVWHHQWKESVSRTVGVKELRPGDADLPDTLPNGEPWPANAGGLQVKTQFNLDTQRGREAHSDVLFFGPEQEWSIGYNVPLGGATIDQKTGVRTINKMDLYEYSPVLFGAMPAARTSSVKEAQMAYKSLMGEDTEDERIESESDEDGLLDTDEKADEILELLEQKGAPGKSFTLSAVQAAKLHRTANLILDLLRDSSVEAEEEAAPDEAADEDMGDEEVEGASVADLAADVFDTKDVLSAATAFDVAHDNGDGEAMEEEGDKIMTAIENAIDDGDEPGTYEALSSALVKAFDDVGEDEEEDTGDEDDEADTEDEEKSEDEETETLDLSQFADVLD